ncbi:hypothetical protein ACFX1X_027923 [Malus domestica]
MDFLSNPFLFTSLVLLLSIFTAQILAWKPTKRKRKYPPVAGTILHQLLNFNRLHDYMTDLAAKYKTYRLIGPFRNEVYTSNPKNVEYILKTNFDNYGKGWYNYNLLKDLLGDGIFTVDGDKWRQQRKISSHEFSTRMLREFSSAVFQKNAAKVADKLSEIATASQTIDIQDMFMKSTLDSIFKVAFGTELDNMCGSSQEGRSFGDAFDNSSALSLWRYVDVFWRIKKFLNLGSEAALRKNIKIIDEFVFKLIHTKIEQMQKNDDSSVTVDREDILSRFLQASETNPVYLRDIILNFIIADSLSEDVLEKMHYLHAAITETLRIYPAVPVDAKICFSDDTLPDGYGVRKGDMVSYQPYAMGRMKFIWGDDAEEFRPERWLNENGVFQPESPFKFTAFQAGPRMCLGKEFAYRQLKIFSAVLLSCFVFKLSDENAVVTYRTMINLHIKGGLQVRAFHRD